MSGKIKQKLNEKFNAFIFNSFIWKKEGSLHVSECVTTYFIPKVKVKGGGAVGVGVCVGVCVGVGVCVCVGVGVGVCVGGGLGVSV